MAQNGQRLGSKSWKGFRANIILWGMPRDVSTLEVRAKLADLGLTSFVNGKFFERVITSGLFLLLFIVK